MGKSIKLILGIFKRINKSLELLKYNNFTIVEYFRKQGAVIGEGCFIVPRKLATEPYLVRIGNHVCLSSGVALHTHDGGTWIFRGEQPDLRVFGPIIIEDNCLIGNNAQILPNVRIGHNSIVGAGSVVISDVPPNSIVMGIPARKFGSVEKYKDKCQKLWSIQRPPNFHPDSLKHYDQIENRDLVLQQLRDHLCELYKKPLSK
jgi:acetyltransferase-like isoleucine patch superfamily enzyme